jgi:hypothetical protein
MSRLGRAVLDVYVGLFAFWARDPQHAHDEQELLAGSTEYAYRRLRDGGRTPLRALALSLWLHLGELQPIALIAKVRASNQRVSDRKSGHWPAAAGAVVLAVVAVTALFIWSLDALYWIFGLMIGGMLLSSAAVAVWGARHRGARLLIPLVPLFILWPLVVGFIAEDWGGAIRGTIGISLLLAAMLGTQHAWRRGQVVGWPTPTVLWVASLPLWGSAALWLYGGSFQVLRRYLIDELSLNARDQTGLLFAFVFVTLVLLAAYCAIVALVVTRAARHLTDRPAPSGEASEAVSR